MKRTFILLMIFFTAFSFGRAQGISSTSPVTKGLQEEIENRGGEEFIEVIIRMKEQYDSQALIQSTWGMSREQKRDYTISVLKQYAEQSQRELLDFIADFENADAAKDVKSFWMANVISGKLKPSAIRELAKRNDIERIGFDHKRILIDPDSYKNANAVPGNPKATQREITWNITKINADDVWGIGFNGEGVTVAVIDAGVNYNHVDLADHMWEDPAYPYHGYDFANNDNNPMDDHGHGTHCAGTVAGDGTAGSQTGVAPEASIMALKVLDAGGGGQQSYVWEAVEFTIENGGDIMSISLGWQHSWGVDRESFRNFFDNALAAGVIASVAAGNEGNQQWQYPIPDNVRTPGDIPPPWLHPDQTLEGGLSSVMCVGATDIGDNIAGFSSRGPVTWENVSGYNDYPYSPEMGLIRPDIVAPGDNIKSLDAFNNTGYADGWSGTSMATPANAGMLALMLQKNQLLSPAEMDQIVEETALSLSSSKSNTFGSGRIDALAAVNATPFPEPPSADFESDLQVIYTGEEVSFTDLSSNFPTEWEWEFQGGTPTNSTEQNPTVVYNETGSFSVTLTASNGSGSDTETKEDYIQVVESHFTFEGGNPADPVYTMYISGGTIEDEALDKYDEIAIYDGETMVGLHTLEQAPTPDNQFENDLIAFSTVVSGEGYTPGNNMMLKVWNATEGAVSTNVDITFYNPYGDAWTDPVFPEGDGEYSIADLDFMEGAMQQMSLNAGYQFVSSHMVPANPDLMMVLEDQMSDETLDFVRNTDGSMFQKIGPNWVNNIGDWMTKEGYLFKMLEGDMLSIEGAVMDPQTPIELATGYQFISYLPPSPMDALDAFDGVLDNLDFVRNSEGSMLQKIGPNWVNNIGDLHPGQGYLVKMNAADELIYPEMATKSGIKKLSNKYFDFKGGNPADPVFTVFVQPDESIAIGDEIAVFDGDKMVGAGMIDSEKAMQNDIPVFATLTNQQGYEPGNELTIKVYDASTNELTDADFELVNPYGDASISGTFPAEDGAYSVAKLTKSAAQWDQTRIYPNPANEVLNVTANSNIDLIMVYDYTGKLVREIAPAGENAQIKVDDLDAGIYVIKIETETGTVNKRIVIE